MAFTSKLLKKAWEGELFTYVGMVFDIEKAEQIIAAHPRPSQKAPKKFLEAFVGSIEQDKREEETGTFSMLNVGLKKEHVDEVDENKPGIVAVITFKPSKSFPEQSTNYILIDGNHRAKKRLRMGFEDMDVYILTPEESWEIMAPNTFAGLTKNLVNPTKKESKPRPPRPKSDKPSKADERRADIQARLDFINQHAVPSSLNLRLYMEKFGEPLWMDDLTEEKEYLESQLKKKKRAYQGWYTPQEVARNTGADPVVLGAEWYELSLVPEGKEPPKKDIIRISPDFAYVPVEQHVAAERPKQEYTSERTSVNQLPAVFNRVEWQPKTVNLDYGGGRFDNAVEFLKGKGVTNLVFDPYNRAAEHNKDIMHKLKKRKADTATIANVLNVIKEPEIRKQVMRKVRGLVKPGGFVYVMCYRGRGECSGPTCNGWQENRPIKTYLEEVQQVFGDAEVQGQMIVARV
jgi:hypothetical protein